MSLTDSKERNTDSFGSRSDHSGQSIVLPGPKPRMDVVCVMDFALNERLSSRKRAFEEIKATCNTLGASCHHIQVSYLVIYVNITINKANFEPNIC